MRRSGQDGGMTDAPVTRDLEPLPDAEAEVVQLTQELIRIDSSNWGDSPETVGEAEAADYCAARLREVGLDPEIIVTTSDSRRAVHVRIPGTDPGAGALLLHGHIDVVPAMAEDWTHPPFAGELADGFVWGRGAVDMKDMDAMILSVVRSRVREGRQPPRDVVVLFLDDEEAGGRFGGHWLVENQRDWFEGCTEAVGEVGGFSLTTPAGRLYLVETAEKGIAWLKLTARGRAGHGSMVNDDNAVTLLAEAVAAIGRHRFPLRLTKTVRRLLDELADAYGIDVDPDDPAALLDRLGSLAIIVGATLRNSAQPTMLQAGYKHNVIPGDAAAFVDGRFLPGYEDEFLAEIDSLLPPGVTREHLVRDIALETDFEGHLVEAMATAITEHDPGSRVVPYCLSGGTDAKAFSLLGIRGFGFAPLQLPPDLDFAGMFHGIDERVPVDGLRFGARVLDRFIDLA
jgi:acetylornithine deacetylase/succinyl-diaminopimelate desuccinylase-like protein